MTIFAQLSVFLMLAVAGSNALADGTNTILLQVAGKLQPVWAGLSPAPDCEYTTNLADGPSLLIRYQSQIVPAAINFPATNGDFFTNLWEQFGPKTNGFVLKITLETLGAGNPIPTPSTHQTINGQTFYNVTPVGGTPWQTFWALSYGDQTDPGLLERIKQNLWQQGFYIKDAAIPNLIRPFNTLPPPVNLQIK